MLAPSGGSSQGSQSSQSSSDATGSFLLQISAYFSPPPPCTPSKCYLMHIHVWVSFYFRNVLETKPVLPSLVCKFVYWTALIHSQLYAESFHRPKKAHISLSFSYLLPYSWVLLPALPGKREILFSGFSAFTLFVGSLSLMSVDSSLSKRHLSFLWALRKTQGTEKTIIVIMHYIHLAFKYILYWKIPKK